MKTTRNVTSFGRFLQWVAFLAAFASMIAIVAAMAGLRSEFMPKLPPSVAQSQGYAANVDINAIFNAH